MKKRVSYQTRKYLSAVLFIAVIAVLIMYWFGSSVMQILNLMKMKSDLTAQIQSKTELSAQLDEDMKQIGTKAYNERIAHDYLKLYYPNEKIVIPVQPSQENSKENETPAQTDQENLQASEMPVEPSQENTQTNGTEVTDGETVIE